MPKNFKNSVEHVQQLYGRATCLVYYDVTNFYCEIDGPEGFQRKTNDCPETVPDGFRKKGLSKEHRPNSKQEHIEVHFLTCFLSLVIARILEMKMGHRYSIARILESLRKAECTYLQQHYYLFDYYDDVLKDIGKIFNIDFSKRIRSLGDIKKILATTKK